MFVAAGQIIPAVTGVSWDEFVKQRIFGPLEMKSTNTSMPSRPGEFHPEALTDPDVHLSIHPARVTQ